MKIITHKWLIDHFKYVDGNLIYVKKYHNSKRTIGESIGDFNGHKYKNVTLLYKRYYVHRLIWFYFNKRWPKELDHIDRDKSNCRIENLRECSHSQNHSNAPKKVSQTGFRGVIKRRNKTVSDTFVARIMVSKKYINIGTYDNPQTAAKAYNRAALKYFGEFAWLNKI